MDLRTIKEDLLGGNYESPLDFCKDMKLIFQNSRNYNTNKRSRVSLLWGCNYMISPVTVLGRLHCWGQINFPPQGNSKILTFNNLKSKNSSLQLTLYNRTPPLGMIRSENSSKIHFQLFFYFEKALVKRTIKILELEV